MGFAVTLKILVKANLLSSLMANKVGTPRFHVQCARILFYFIAHGRRDHRLAEDSALSRCSVYVNSVAMAMPMSCLFCLQLRTFCCRAPNDVQGQEPTWTKSLNYAPMRFVLKFRYKPHWVN